MSCGLHPQGAGKQGYLLKCCPDTLLNADTLFTITQISQEAVWVKNLRSVHITPEQVTTFSANQTPKYFWVLAFLGLKCPPVLWP